MVVSLLIIVAGTALAVLAMLLIRRLAPPRGLLGDIESADGVYAVPAGAGIAVILAFVIFTVFSSYENGREASGQEAVAARPDVPDGRVLPGQGGPG